MMRRLLLACFVALVPGFALAQSSCNPPTAPVGSVGCLPLPNNPGLTTTLYSWQAELGQNAARQMSISTLFSLATQLTSAGLPIPQWTTAGRPTPANPMIGLNADTQSLDLWTGHTYLSFAANWELGPVNALTGLTISGTTLTAQWQAGVVTGLIGASIDGSGNLVVPSSSLPNLSAGSVLANSTASTAQAAPTTLTALLDKNLGSTPGLFALRGASGWQGAAITGAVTVSSTGVSAFSSFGAKTVLGNAGTGSAVPVPLSQTQLTALINPATSTTAGTVPASGGGPANFLRADFTWVPVSQITSVTAGAGLTGGGNTGVVGISLASIPPNSFFGNPTATNTAPTTLTGTQATALLVPFSTTSQGVVPAAPADASHFLRSDNTWATLPGGGTITSVVAGSGLAGGGSSGSVTVSFAQIAGNSVLGVIGTTAAVPSAIGQAQLTALILPFSPTTSGAVPASPGGTAAFLRADGTFATPPGGITGVTAGSGLSGGGNSGVVTLALANIAPLSVLGNATNATAAAGPLSQVQLTALINPYSTTAAGVVPPSPGGSTSFLRADNVWATPPLGITTVTVATGLAGGGSGPSVSIALVSAPNNTVQGNVSGAAAVPGPLTQAQLTALVNPFALTTAGLVPAPGTSQGFCLHDNPTTPWASCSAITAITAGTGLTGGGSSGSVSLALAAIPAGTGLVNATAGTTVPTPTTLLAWMAQQLGVTRGTLVEAGASGYQALPYTATANLVLTSVPGGDPAWLQPQSSPVVNGMNFPLSSTAAVPSIPEVLSANNITYAANVPTTLGGSGATTVAGARVNFAIDAGVSQASPTATIPCNGVVTTQAGAASANWPLPASTACNNGSTVLVIDEAGLVSPAAPLTISAATGDKISWPNQSAQSVVQLTAPNGYIGFALDAANKRWNVYTQFAANSDCTDVATYRCTEPINSTTFAFAHEFTNDTTTGTINGQLAMATNTGAGGALTAIRTNASAAFALGVVISGGGTTGSAIIAVHGPATCLFDATGVTTDHWVIPSTTVGLCKDSGTLNTATAPANAVGIAMATGAGSNSYPVYVKE